MGKIFLIAENPLQHDVKPLHGYAPWHRADIGEYRIIFSTDGEWLRILIVGKRNDSDVYKRFSKLFK